MSSLALSRFGSVSGLRWGLYCRHFPRYGMARRLVVELPHGARNGGRLRPQNRLRAGSFPWLQTAFWYKGGKEPLPGTQERTME